MWHLWTYNSYTSSNAEALMPAAYFILSQNPTPPQVTWLPLKSELNLKWGAKLKLCDQMVLPNVQASTSLVASIRMPDYLVP